MLFHMIRLLRFCFMLLALCCILGAQCDPTRGGSTMPPLPDGGCPDPQPGSCPGDCWCPGGGGPGCFQSMPLVSFVPQTMLPASSEQVSAIQRAVARLYVRRHVELPDLPVVALNRPLRRVRQGVQ